MYATVTNCNDYNSYYVKYKPELKKRYGCHITALIVEQLEFWFSKKPFGFYKFIEPCSHYLYRSGDSWTEEIGISRKTFTRCFDKIGIRYNSKSAFIKSEDRFKGFKYASYYDRKTNQVYFIRDNSNPKKNNHLINSSLKNFSVKGVDYNIAAHDTIDRNSIVNCNTISLIDEFPRIAPTDSIKSLNTSKHISELPQIKLSLDYRYRNGQSARSFMRMLDNNLIHKNTFHFFKEYKNVDKIIENDFNTLKKALALQMIQIWKQIVGHSGLSFYSVSMLKSSYETLESEFQGSLYDWQEYCKTIASSKFLMGEFRNNDRKGSQINYYSNPILISATNSIINTTITNYSNNHLFDCNNDKQTLSTKTSNFKAYLLWAIKPETIARIRNKEFSLDDRTDEQTKIKLQQQSQQQLQIQTKLQQLNYQQKQIEQELETVASDIERERRSTVGKQVDQSLSISNIREKVLKLESNLKAVTEERSEIEKYHQEFEFEQQQEATYFAQQFQQHGWKVPQTDWHFKCFLSRKLADQYFGISQEEMMQQRKNQLHQKLDKLQEQKQQLLSSSKYWLQKYGWYSED